MIRRRTISSGLLVMCLALISTGLAACNGNGRQGLLGYHADELFPDEFRTVQVDIFDNRTFYRGIEFDVTEALIKEIELRTPYKVVSGGTADTTLTGTVVAVNQRPLSRSRPGGLPQEMQVTVTVSYEWKAPRTGQVIRKRTALVGSGEYIPTRSVGESFETAQHRAAVEIARDMVSDMRQDW